MKRVIVHVIALVALCIGLASAGPNDPIVGEEFEEWTKGPSGNAVDLANGLLPDTAGYLTLAQPSNLLTHSSLCPVTVCTPLMICPGVESLYDALILFKSNRWETENAFYWLEAPNPPPRPCRSAYVWFDDGTGSLCNQLMLVTVNEVRVKIWAGNTITPFVEARRRDNNWESQADLINGYAQAVSDYLYSLDTGWMEAPAPKAIDYGLPDSLDFYADPPDYVIEGYENYQNFLHSHDTIWTDFANGVTSFVLSDSLWEAMKINAPREAYPNKEWPMLQHEYRKFFERGGDVRVMNTLTREGFDTLQAGEYFFAVSVAGKVRFGRELLRAEVKQIEEETGKKVPRVNHAFLFPGEPVLTAGAFFIEIDDEGRQLTKINAQSGHYFYSNVSPTIREDIVERSDHYLLTLGHFFAALDSLSIPHDNVLISKL